MVTGIIGVIILAGLAIALKNLIGLAGEESAVFEKERLYLPIGKENLEIVHHQFYSLAYDEEKEGAAWVAYELLGSNVEGPWVSRTNDFRPDPIVSTGSTTNSDFKGSGFDRGHLVPAADMAFSETAMSETFLMSNISPQKRAFNHGVWRELEELTRDWAKQNERLVVVSGPIWNQSNRKVGKANKMLVPDAYFKVLLDIDLPQQKSVGFVIPNELQTQRLEEFAKSVDEVEALTGFDFFKNYIEPGLQDDLEADFSIKDWPTNEKKYKIRLERWNKE
jgi:endonuclease G